jgi:ParB family transcriptional regulator, chromosome partitioning protein
MSQPKRGLGKGLGALLGDGPVPTSPAATAQAPIADEAMREIAVERITPNPFQPRKSFDTQAMDELQASIAEYGVLVPIIVRKRGENFELIAGERRWRASAALKRTTIPAIVRESDDRDSLEVAIIENLQRENLNPLEEAAGFASLMDEHGFTQEDLAQRLGKSRPAVANALRLLALPDAIKAMLSDGRLTAGHGRALLMASAQDRVKLAQRAIDEALSVRALEKLATAQKPVAAPPVQRDLSADEQSFETQLRERYGVRVALVRAGSGGRIEFRFGSDSELIRLGELLLDQ